MNPCPICQSDHVLDNGGIWNSRCGSCGWVWDDPSKLPTIEVADSIGEIVAFRAWDVIETSDGLRIKSQGAGWNANDVWNPGEVLNAKCGRGEGHRAPDEGCTCGFYAAANRAHLVSLNTYHRFDRLRRLVVMGEVMMDGKVVPATLGYRGENIWPVKIVVPHSFGRGITLPEGMRYGWEVAAALRDTYGPYGVTIEMDNTLNAEAHTVTARVEFCQCGRKKVDGLCPRHDAPRGLNGRR